MRDFHLRFVLKDLTELRGHGWYDNESWTPFDLFEDDTDQIPNEPGAYVLGTADGTVLTYPWGVSPVYYIGMASRLQERVSEHCKHMIECRADHEEWWWPRYQYGAAYGAHCVWYFACDQEPQNIEATLVQRFYTIYGSIPVANLRWPKFLPTPGSDEDG